VTKGAANSWIRTDYEKEWKLFIANPELTYNFNFGIEVNCPGIAYNEANKLDYILKDARGQFCHRGEVFFPRDSSAGQLIKRYLKS